MISWQRSLPCRDDLTKPIQSTKTNEDTDARRRSGKLEGGGDRGSPNEEKELVPVPDSCCSLVNNKRDQVCYGHPLLYCTLDRDTDMVYRDCANKRFFTFISIVLEQYYIADGL